MWNRPGVRGLWQPSSSHPSTGEALDADHQHPVGAEGAPERQGVHVVGQQGLVGECVTDAPVFHDLQEQQKQQESGDSPPDREVLNTHTKSHQPER